MPLKDVGLQPKISTLGLKLVASRLGTYGLVVTNVAAYHGILNGVTETELLISIGDSVYTVELNRIKHIH